MRIPFILYALHLPVREMVIANLLISLFTSGSNFTLRLVSGLLTTQALFLGVAMIAGSIVGSYLGAIVSHRFSERGLKAFVAIVLSIVVGRLILDFFLEANRHASIIPAPLEWPIAALFGLLVGIVAGGIGVAGGEYRIPILIFIFGLPIKIAGTASQLVSIPTVIVAVMKHRGFGVLTRRVIKTFLAMGIPSIVGALVVVQFLVQAAEELVRLIFAAILTYTIISLFTELSAKRELIKR